ncbi:MAG: hypothetical protein AAFY83_06625 [Pseudomonadota bacterium]
MSKRLLSLAVLPIVFAFAAAGGIAAVAPGEYGERIVAMALIAPLFAVGAMVYVFWAPSGSRAVTVLTVGTASFAGLAVIATALGR